MNKYSKVVKDVIHGKVNIHIGKAGISNGVIEQMKNQFKTRKMLKIKFLNLTKFQKLENAINFLAAKTNAEVLDIRGNTCVLKVNE